SRKCQAFVSGSKSLRAVSGQTDASAIASATALGFDETPRSLATFCLAIAERLIAATRATIRCPSVPHGQAGTEGQRIVRTKMAVNSARRRMDRLLKVSSFEQKVMRVNRQIYPYRDSEVQKRPPVSRLSL